MSNILLIASNVTIEPYPVYPLGMAVIASALQTKGHYVSQIDFLASGESEPLIIKKIGEIAPNFIGISIRNIDNVDSMASDSEWYLDQTRKLVTLIKKETQVPIIIGGPAFSIMPEVILEYVGADYGIAGEGEKEICRLVSSLENKIEVPKIIKGKKLLRATEICSPLFEKELVKYYMDNSGMINFQTKRGCPHNCLYCTYPSLEGNKFRPGDPKRVVNDILKIQKDHNVNSFFFTDSVFNDAAGHYLEFAEELISMDAGIRWAGFFRPQGMDRNDIRLLKRSGLYAMEVGTDAASDITMNGINKGFCFDDVMNFNQACVEEGMPLAHFVIFGGPGETEATVNQGLDNMNKLERCVVFAFSGIRILPGTGLQAKAIEDGIISTDMSLLKPVYYFSNEIEPEEMNKTIESRFKNRPDRLFPPSENQMRVRALNVFGIHGLLWDMLIGVKAKRKKKRCRPKN